MNFSFTAQRLSTRLWWCWSHLAAQDTIAPAVQEVADEVVPWDQRQLVDAVKRQARHEETTRFDTIEFKLD